MAGTGNWAKVVRWEDGRIMVSEPLQPMTAREAMLFAAYLVAVTGGQAAFLEMLGTMEG